MTKRRSRHRVPVEQLRLTEEVSPDYQAEVDQAVQRAERRYRLAHQRLAAAEQKLAKAEQIKSKAQRNKAVLVARELLELRRQELLDLQRAMSGAPASTVHRGAGWHRPALPMKTL